MALGDRPMRQKYPKAVSVVHSSVTAALPSRSPTPQRILLWEAGLVPSDQFLREKHARFYSHNICTYPMTPF